MKKYLFIVMLPILFFCLPHDVSAAVSAESDIVANYDIADLSSYDWYHYYSNYDQTYYTDEDFARLDTIISYYNSQGYYIVASFSGEYSYIQVFDEDPSSDFELNFDYRSGTYYLYLTTTISHHFIILPTQELFENSSYSFGTSSCSSSTTIDDYVTCNLDVDNVQTQGIVSSVNIFLYSQTYEYSSTSMTTDDDGNFIYDYLSYMPYYSNVNLNWVDFSNEYNYDISYDYNYATYLMSTSINNIFLYNLIGSDLDISLPTVFESYFGIKTEPYTYFYDNDNNVKTIFLHTTFEVFDTDLYTYYYYWNDDNCVEITELDTLYEQDYFDYHTSENGILKFVVFDNDTFEEVYSYSYEVTEIGDPKSSSQTGSIYSSISDLSTLVESPLDSLKESFIYSMYWLGNLYDNHFPIIGQLRDVIDTFSFSKFCWSSGQAFATGDSAYCKPYIYVDFDGFLGLNGVSLNVIEMDWYLSYRPYVFAFVYLGFGITSFLIILRILYGTKW